ncbi:hypothetical protein AVEN_102886-1 [Araneus ventricosus]|uniref:Uncharacterized protein n=1 Tax=Araneus ventricosus TaxID=182803 RepID=A0A4Y2M097_ARAVE|nr:hypothetical protein AVEN_102886-1 [Araneus ventricosus]
MRGCRIIGLRAERSHHLQSVCLQDVVLVDHTDGIVWLVSATVSTLQTRLSPKRFPSDYDDDDEMMTTLNTNAYCG